MSFFMCQFRILSAFAMSALLHVENHCQQGYVQGKKKTKWKNSLHTANRSARRRTQLVKCTQQANFGLQAARFFPSCSFLTAFCAIFLPFYPSIASKASAQGPLEPWQPLYLQFFQSFFQLASTTLDKHWRFFAFKNCTTPLIGPPACPLKRNNTCPGESSFSKRPFIYGFMIETGLLQHRYGKEEETVFPK